MPRLRIVLMGICTVLLVSLFLACGGHGGSAEATASVRSVDTQKETITLADATVCGSTPPVTVQFNNHTKILDLNGNRVESSELEHATRISFECVKKGPVTQITIKGTSQEVKCVDFQTSTVTLAGGEGCGSTSPPTVKFDDKTRLLDPNGDHGKVKRSDLVRATSISFECGDKGPVKNITLNGTSEDVQFVQGNTITLVGNVGCGSTSPPTVQFDSDTPIVDLNGHKVYPSSLQRAPSISFECAGKGLTKNIAINAPSDKKPAPFSLGRVVDSVVANTGRDRFSDVEGDLVFQPDALIWKLDPNAFPFSTGTCCVVAGDGGPNYFQCTYDYAKDSQMVSELFKEVQGTMSTFNCFRLDEGRSSQSVRTYIDQDNRVRVTVKACIAGENQRGQVDAKACTPNKDKRNRVDVEGCTLMVEVIPTPH